MTATAVKPGPGKAKTRREGRLEVPPYGGGGKAAGVVARRAQPGRGDQRLAHYGPNEIVAKKTNQFLKLLSYFWGPSRG